MTTQKEGRKAPSPSLMGRDARLDWRPPLIGMVQVVALVVLAGEGVDKQPRNVTPTSASSMQGRVRGQRARLLLRARAVGCRRSGAACFHTEVRAFTCLNCLSLLMASGYCNLSLANPGILTNLEF